MKKDKPRLPTSLDAIIGQRIKQGRQLRGLSQEDLAERLAVSFQQVQKYEKASNRVSASRLFEIAKILELPFPYFFATKDIVPKGLDLVMDEDSVAILRAFQPLSKQKRKVVRALLTQLATAA